MESKAKRRMKYAVILVLIIGLIMLAFFKFNIISSAVNKVVSLLAPLIVGCVIAFVVNVPMRAFEKLFTKMRDKSTSKKKKISDTAIKYLSLIISILAFLIVFAIVGIVVVPRIALSIVSIYNLILDSYPKALAFLEKQKIDTTVLRQWINDIDIMKILTTLKDNAKNIVDTISVAASSVAGVLVNVVTGVVLAVYILANKKLLTRQCKKIIYAFFKKPAGDKICKIAALSNYTFSSFVAGQAIECIILCLMFLVVLSIFKIPYAAVISIIIAVLAIIPYIGAFAGCVAGVLLILMAEPGKAILFVIIFVVLQQIENHLVYPRVVGKSVGLPPMWTLLAAILGGKLFGVLGLIFFIPFASVLYTLLRTDVHSRLEEKNLEISEEDGKVIEKSESKGSSNS